MEQPRMTKYEYARVKGIRMQQLIDGMKPFVETNKDDNEEEIFLKELKAKKIPLMITRPSGFNKSIDIPLSEMNVDMYI
tara:strand:- start:298 stop:534 length:237 start_codon:yes stop_codon:yes gene_type:complete